MKAVLLAGGLGTRLSEETHLKPKPMVEIGGKPVLWHIMKGYSSHGINEFVICAGYKGYMIKEYFANYLLHMSDITIDTAEDKLRIHHRRSEPWKVTIVDTGESTMTGGRLRRVREYIEGETFCFTYGDGVGDVDIGQLIEFHRRQGTKATLTAVQPPGRFGSLAIRNNKIAKFQEKPIGDGDWINGGFFVLEPDVFDYLQSDETVWERAPIERLATESELSVYKHRGFWQPMDTLSDKVKLEKFWDAEQAPWKIW